MKFHITIKGKETRDYTIEDVNRVCAVEQAGEQYLEEMHGREPGICDHFETFEWYEIGAGKYENYNGWDSDEGEKLEGDLTALVTPMGGDPK